MSAPLPELLDPWRAVQFGAAFAGEAPLETFPRLVALVNEGVLRAAGSAHYALRFERDERGRAVARGRVSMVLRLTCQRCLGEVEVPVDAAIALALVRAVGEAARLGLAAVPEVPAHLDPLPLGDEPVHAMDWVEDELLLAIPQVPMHPRGHCTAGVTAVGGAVVPARPASPFAILAALQERHPEADEP